MDPLAPAPVPPPVPFASPVAPDVSLPWGKILLTLAAGLGGAWATENNRRAGFGLVVLTVGTLLATVGSESSGGR